MFNSFFINKIAQIEIYKKSKNLNIPIDKMEIMGKIWRKMD